MFADLDMARLSPKFPSQLLVPLSEDRDLSFVGFPKRLERGVPKDTIT